MRVLVFSFKLFIFMHDFKNINNKNLGIIAECPVCKFKDVDLNIIEENGSGYLLHSKCSKCKNAIIMIAVNNDIGINVIGMNTDLSMEEFIKFRSYGKAVVIDDVLAIHKKPILINLFRNLFITN